MTLPFFLLFLIVIPLLLAVLLNSKIQNNPVTQVARVCFILIIAAVTLSYWTFTNYSQRTDNEYYKTTDSYVLEHVGYQMDSNRTVYLFSEDSSKYLLGTGVGELSISNQAEHVNLNSRDFNLPIFVSYDTVENNGLLHSNSVNKTDHYKIVNNIINRPLRNNSVLLITRADNIRDTVLFLRYREISTVKWKLIDKSFDHNFLFDIKLEGCLMDTGIAFDKFYHGYPILNIASQGIHTSYSKELETIFAHSLLVREKLHLSKKHNPGKSKTVEDLYFFPGNELIRADSLNIYLDNNLINRLDFINSRDIPVLDKLFFCGIGKDKSPTIKVGKVRDKIKISFRLSKKYFFPDLPDTVKNTNFYLTTSLQDIIDNSDQFKNWYRYNNIQSTNNIYHIGAIVNYDQNEPNITLNPELIDINKKGSVRNQPIDIGKEFSLLTRTNTGLNYVFKISDLRNNIITQNSHLLYLFLIIAFSVIYFLILKRISGKKEKMLNWVILASATYLIFIAFLTVRLILQWRLLSFPPINDISFDEYSTLVNNNNFKFIIFASIFFLSVRIVILALASFGIYLKAEKLVNLNSIRIYRVLFWNFFIYLGLLGLYMISNSSSLGVFLKVPAVIILFSVLQSAYISLLIRGKLNNLNFIKITSLNILLPICYWLYSDKGVILAYSLFISIFVLIIGIGRIMHSRKKAGKNSVLISSIAGIVFLFIISQFFLPLNLLDYVDFKSIDRYKYRAMVLHSSPDDLIRKVPFKSDRSKLILEATSNYWFIHNHLEYRKKGIENNSSNRFNLYREASKQGVSYTVQTRELCVLRYLIFEHGHIIPVLLILALAFYTLLIKLNIKENFNELHPKPSLLLKIPFLISLYLLVFSLYVYLLNQNILIFVGQDFPFMSLTSGMVTITFPIMLLVILISMPLKEEDSDFFKSSSFTSDGARENKHRILKFLLFACMFIVLMLLIFPDPVKKLIRSDMDKQSGNFNITEPVYALNNFIEDYLNEDFSVYQYQAQNNLFRRAKPWSTDVKNELNKYFDRSGQSSGMRWLRAEIGNYLRTNGDIEDSLFITSAFQEFIKTNLKEIDHIIHLKRNNGLYEFKINRNYFKIKDIFKERDSTQIWKGNLTGAATKPMEIIKILDGSDRSIDLKNNDICRNIVSKYRNFFLPTQPITNESLSIVVIPGSFCFSKSNILVANLKKLSTVTENEIKIISQGNISSKSIISGRFATFKLNSGDIVQVDNRTPFRVINKTENYFAKTLVYNGEENLFYPLGDNFIYAYNLANTLHQSWIPKKEDENVRISLDYKLTEALQKVLADALILDKSVDGSVVAIDGNGRIRAMADFDPSSKKLDPNNQQQFEKKLLEYYFDGEREGERLLLSNRNVQLLRDGPGSTMKPFIYSSIVSQINLGWENIVMCDEPSGPWVSHINDEAIVTYFGDIKIIHGDPVGWNETFRTYTETMSMNPSLYISKSNNYYNGMIVLLGSFRPDVLMENFSGISNPECKLFATNKSMPEAGFPRFSFNGNQYYLKDNFIDDLEPEHSSLEAGLENNYDIKSFIGIADKYLFSSSADTGLLKDLGWGFCTRATIKGTKNAEYTFPERSSFIRNTSINRDNFYMNIINVAKGGTPIRVTPLKMAESAIRLASLNRKLNATLQDSIRNPEYQSFQIARTRTVGNYPDDIAYRRILQNTLFDGMFKVPRSGTLASDNDFVKSLIKTNDTIYLYAKTGTNNYNKGAGTNNKHYLYILSNHRLGIRILNSAPLKVYSIYMTFYNAKGGNSHSLSVRHNIINAILESETFKSYWYEK